MIPNQTGGEGVLRNSQVVRQMRPLPQGQVTNLRGNIAIKREFLESLSTNKVNENPVTITTFRNELVPGSNDDERKYECPMSAMTDSYKTTHFLMYRAVKEMRAYGECRQKFDNPNIDDNRIVVYGTKYYIENFINRPLTSSDIGAARTFLTGHLLTPKAEKDLYFKANYSADAKVTDLNYLDLLLKHGKWPVKIEAMPEGSVIRPNIPIYIITAKDEHSRLCTFLETILTMLWYPCSVATLSRHTKTLIEEAYKKSVPAPISKLEDPDDVKTELGYKLSLESRLHDFGFRGCTSVEQSVIGGCAHLLNFGGSDTISAAYYAQYMLNNGVPVAKSIPATEHSVMTSFNNEIEAIKNLCDQFPGGMIACVWDAYNYEDLLEIGLPVVREYVKLKKCKLIVRPDSGDPVQQVLLALRKALEHKYEYETFTVPQTDGSTKTFKYFKYLGVIQGDGISYDTVKKILDAVLAEGYAACNVAFGMGGGLLQKINRDTMSFATKLCYLENYDGSTVDVMKAPKDVGGKTSLPGKMMVLHEIDPSSGKMIGPHRVYTEEEAQKKLKMNFKNSMQVIYDGTEKTTPKTSQTSIDIFRNESFQDVRDRLSREWLIDHTRDANDGGAIDISLKKFRDQVLDRIRQRKLPTQPLHARLSLECDTKTNYTETEFSTRSSTEQLLHMLDKLC